MGIQESIEKMTKGNVENYSIVATVDSVDKNKRTCTVIPINDTEDKLFGVRLQAKQSINEGIVLFPVAGSEVVVTFMNKQSGYISLFSQLESYENVIGTAEINFDKDGLLVKSAIGSLLSSWTDLIDIIKNLKLSTNMGVTIAVLPPIIVKLEALELKIKSILKDS